MDDHAAVWNNGIHVAFVTESDITINTFTSTFIQIANSLEGDQINYLSLSFTKWDRSGEQFGCCLSR